MELSKNKYAATLLFWMACAFIFFISDGYKTIFLRPQSVHVWRQTDCASYALNYYQNNQAFFEPQTHTLTGKDGHAVSEFPIIYYVAGKLYHVFGPQEYIIRGINFFIFLFGCSCLLWLGFELYNNIWLAFVPALITYTSPYLFYYGLNFLPDVPAISLSLAGCFFLFRYFRTRTLTLAYVAALTFCLAMLLKISAGIALLAITGALISTGEANNRINKKHRINFVGLFVLIVVINIAWVEFAKYYNRANGTGQNLLGLFPIWDADRNEVFYIIKRTFKEWSRVILHPFTWIWVSALLLLVANRRRSLDKFMQAVLLFNILGVTAYSLLWFRAYQHHDYYMINPFIAIVWVMLSAGVVIDKSNAISKSIFGATFIVILYFSVSQCRYIQWKRYNDPAYKSFSGAYFTIEPYLRSIGISRFDKVVSVPDVSPNITLYFLNQPGWTEAFNNDNYNMDYFAAQGAKYLIVADTSLWHQPLYARHIGSPVGKYEGIYIYRIKK